MTEILNVLQHRATVERSTETLVDGVPVRAWTVTGVRVPVLRSRDEVVNDPSWTASQRHEAGIRATLFSLATTDIEPGDRVHVTRPPLGGSYEVLADPADIYTLQTVSHREHRVRSVT